jgi:prevent-host-death family protein
MKTATAREMQHQFGRVLARVGRGETVVITKHGKKVAQLCPMPQVKGKVLVWPDFARRMKGHFPDGTPVGLPAGELIREGREERF